MPIKEVIYGLLKVMRSHSWSIAEEEVLRECVKHLADFLYEKEIRTKLFKNGGGDRA